jgi:ClpP class serine protease
VLEGIDPSVLIGSVAAVVVLLALIGFAVMAHINRQQTTHDRQQIVKLRRKRFADYAAAKQEYQRLRKKIETGNTVLIDLIHDLGDDFVGRDSAQQQIAFDEAFEAVASIRQANARANIIVVLHTLGGYARPAHMIAMALKQHLKKIKGHHNGRREPRIKAYIPYVAMSGGTMIALAADKVVMDPTASLGPIDTIYGGFPSDAYKALLEQKGVLATQDVLVMLAHEAEKYDQYALKVAREIVNPAHKPHGKPQDNSLADHLASGRLSHSQAISPKEAKDLGMNVSAKVPEAIYGLVDARIRMINTRLEYEGPEGGDDEGEGGGRASGGHSRRSGDPGEEAKQRLDHQIRQSLRGLVRM